jgi:hemoglobin
MSEAPAELPSPYETLGGRDAVVALARAFYDAMEAHEPELTALHRCVEPGKIDPGVRERFTLFLIGWLGGPQDYMARYGHPRLRMRHAKVPVTLAMRDAWLRSMQRALTAQGVEGDIRRFLDTRFAEVADFLRNVPE